jgi:DNA-binding transcriptional LysR family regulator
LEYLAMPWSDRIKRRLKLRDLDILMAVIDTGTMGKAASRLNLSQPAVSKAIAELETALAVRLVDRGRRGIMPTPFGLALRKRSVAIFNDLRQSVQDIDFLSDPTMGELRIGTTEPIAVTFVGPCVDRLSRKYLSMCFHIVTGDTARLYKELIERNVELVICRMLGPLPDDLTAEVLFHDSLAVLTSAKNPLTRRRKLTLAELMDEPWTLLPSDSLFGALVADAFRASGNALPRRTVVTLSHCVQDDLLATGRFLTVRPSFMLKAAGRYPPLKALPVALPNTPMPIGITTLKNRTLTPLAQLFIENIRAAVGLMVPPHKQPTARKSLHRPSGAAERDFAAEIKGS